MSNVYQIQTAKRTRWFSFKATADSNLSAVALFCALGLLVSLYVMIRYPEFGAVIAQISQF
jgi:hypothetical protein